MAIIYSYPLNDKIKLSDELVGTTNQMVNGKLKTVTRNFLLSDIGQFFTVGGGLQAKIVLTTVGNNGPATLDDITGELNIPEYTGFQDLQQVTDLGATTTETITAAAFIRTNGDGNNILLDNGNTMPIPVFIPSNYGLDEFSNIIENPFARLSDLPAPLDYTPVNKAGDTMLGDLILNGDPSNNLGAVTKQYVDIAVESIVPVYNIAINRIDAITTGTLGTFEGKSYSQNGRNVMINNQNFAITITASSAPNSFIASYTKVGTSNITFSFAGGTATVISPSGLVLSGGPGSTALLTKNSTGSQVYLLINNI